MDVACNSSDPQLQAPLWVLLGYVRVTTVSTKLEANKFPRRKLIWALTQLRTHVHDSFCVVGCIDGTWPCGREGQCGRLIGITNSCLLDNAACHVCVVRWHGGSWLELQESGMQLSCKQLPMQKEKSPSEVRTDGT